MKTGLKPVWAGRDMRLDPFRLPQMVSYAARDDYGDVTFTIDPRGAVVRRVLEMSGLPVTVALPAKAFRGVAARALEDDLGNVTVTLELLHNDPMLCVPLLVAHDLEDVAADWRAWADAYRLPMLLIEADGIARTLEESLESSSRRGSLQGPPQGPRLDTAPPAVPRPPQDRRSRPEACHRRRRDHRQAVEIHSDGHLEALSPLPVLTDHMSAALRFSKSTTT